VARKGIEARNAAGRTVAEEAARYEGLPLVRRCLELGASMRNLLGYAAQGENLELITYLVDRGAGINDLDEDGETPPRPRNLTGDI
jgi:ankyrin repeat protein